MKLINIGFGNHGQRGAAWCAIVSPDSAPVKRICVKEARERGSADRRHLWAQHHARCSSWTPTMSFYLPFSPKRWPAAPPVRPRAKVQRRSKSNME